MSLGIPTSTKEAESKLDPIGAVLRAATEVQEDEGKRAVRYTDIKKVRGTYGDVIYQAVDRKTNQFVILKKLEIDGENGILPCVVREISLMQDLWHPNIVSLCGILLAKTKAFLVMEHVDFDLRRYMDENGPIRDMLTLKWFLYQLLRATAFCHSHRVVHRDLKPENILLDRLGTLKLAKFGLARTLTTRLHNSLTPQVVTLWYRAPEILLGVEQYTTAVDVWSTGCIFAEMLMYRPLFPGETEIGQLLCVFRALGTPTEETWPNVSGLSHYKPTFPQWQPQEIRDLVEGLDGQGLDLIGRMLVCDPSRRISAREALRHPFFDDLKRLLPDSVSAIATATTTLRLPPPAGSVGVRP